MFTLTVEADSVLCRLVTFLSSSTECTKWNSAAFKSLLLFMASFFIWFLVEKTSLVKVGKPISDGIVFVFHLA